MRSKKWINKFNNRVLQLLNYSHTDIRERDKNRITLYFSPTAQLLWKNDHDDKESKTVDGGEHADEREFINRYSEHVARISALLHFFEHGELHFNSESVVTNHQDLQIKEHTVKDAIVICEWYLKEYSQLFNPIKSIEKAGKYVIERMIKQISLTNGIKPSEIFSSGIFLLEEGIKENDLRLICSRFGLKNNTLRFKKVLDWLDERNAIIRRNDTLGTSKKTTAMVFLNDFGCKKLL